MAQKKIKVACPRCKSTNIVEIHGDYEFFEKKQQVKCEKCKIAGIFSRRFPAVPDGIAMMILNQLQPVSNTNEGKIISIEEAFKLTKDFIASDSTESISNDTVLNDSQHPCTETILFQKNGGWGDFRTTNLTVIKKISDTTFVKIERSETDFL